MKETLNRWKARTGLRYAPASSFLVRNRALAEDEACPTLFRFPGAEALLAFFGCRLPTLGAPGSPVVWLSARPLGDELPSVAHFGTLVLLEPLRANPVATEEPGVYLGQNLPLDRLGPVLWAPPSVLTRDLDWDALRTESEAQTLFGPGWQAERLEVEDRLRRHLEADR